MSDLFDYLHWRGDIFMSYRPINDIDNIILSELAYFDFEPFIGNLAYKDENENYLFNEQNGKAVSLLEIRDKIPNLFPIRDFSELDRGRVLKECADTERFASITAQDYINIVDKEKLIQFSAVTFRLYDGSYYISFRGTDSTLIGWREDISLCYEEEIPSQTVAIKYMNYVLEKTSGRVIVGGHSKGGNLAVYASAFCREEYKSRIVKIYSNDGPGFNEKVLSKKEIQQVFPKVTHFVPAGTIIGTMLSMDVERILVESTGKSSVDQHFVTSWVVDRNVIVRADIPTKFSKVFEETMNKMIYVSDYEERKDFVNGIFDAFKDMGAETITDLVNNKSATLSTLHRAARATEGTKRGTKEAFSRFAESGKKAMSMVSKKE